MVVGGFTQGLTEAGLEVVAGVDFWDKAVETYGANFNHLAVKADLTTFSPEEFSECYGVNEVDVIVGGPPCQGFSMAGRRDQRDPRNSLFMEFYRYLKYFQPRALLMENVTGILSMRNAQGDKIIDIIKRKLEEDYRVIVAKLNASDFLVPQNRVRVIIVGVRRDLEITPTQPEPVVKFKEERLPVGEVLTERQQIEGKYYLSEKALNGIKAKRERMRGKGYGFGAQFLKLDQPSYTIPSRYFKDGYDALVRYSDTEVRRLTVEEIKRIQSFPESFTLCGNRKEKIMQLGNAVAPRFAYYLGLHLRSLLED